MSKQTIVVKDFVSDIRAGKTDDELMARYNLDERGLRIAFKKLIRVGAIQESELEERKTAGMIASDVTERHQAPIYYILFSFPIYEAGDLTKEGFVIEISEERLKVAGLSACVGEIKSLLIRADEFADIYPFVFDAVCRWSTADQAEGELIQGFEITNISDTGRQELRKLMRLLSFQGT